MKRAVRSAVLALTVTSAALAQQAMDSVELQGGGVARGTIVELVPGDHVTIELPTGIRTFAWSEVVRVDRAGAPPDPQPQPGPAVIVQPGEPSTRVLLDAPSPVSMYRMNNHGEVSTACVAPCGEVLPLTGLYWVAGRDVNASDKFQLPPNRAETKLFVSGGSKAKVTTGVVLAVLGGNMAIVVGLPVVLLGVLFESNVKTRDAAGATLATGIGVVGAGVIMGVVGLALWLSNTSSLVETTAKRATTPRQASTPWLGGF